MCCKSPSPDQSRFIVATLQPSQCASQATHKQESDQLLLRHPPHRAGYATTCSDASKPQRLHTAPSARVAAATAPLPPAAARVISRTSTPSSTTACAFMPHVRMRTQRVDGEATERSGQRVSLCCICCCTREGGARALVAATPVQALAGGVAIRDAAAGAAEGEAGARDAAAGARARGGCELGRRGSQRR